MAEAICRLSQTEFVDSLPDRLVEAEHCDLPTLLKADATRKYLEEYLTRFGKGLKGDDGKTAQYWLQYVDMVNTLPSLASLCHSNEKFWWENILLKKNVANIFSALTKPIMQDMELITQNNWKILK